MTPTSSQTLTRPRSAPQAATVVTAEDGVAVAGGCRRWGRRQGGGASPPMGSPPTAATTGHGWPGRIEIQGFAACGERVAMDGHPGLAQSTDCAAQWLPGSELAATTGFL